MIHSSFKFKTLFLPFLAISTLLSANLETCRELKQKTDPYFPSKPFIELKTGYFSFSDSTLRKIYDEGGLDIQLCASYPLWKLTWKWAFDAYGSIEYFHRSGKSMNGQEATSLWAIPINIGIKPIYRISTTLQAYMATGPRYFYVHQHNHSPYVYKNNSRNGLGLFANVGLYYDLNDHVAIDIFTEYSYAKIHFHNREDSVYTTPIQMGGFSFGLGLSYKL